MKIKKLVREPYFDVGYSNESGLRELVQRAGSLMDKIDLDAERELVDRFLRESCKLTPRQRSGRFSSGLPWDMGQWRHCYFQRG